MPAAPVDVHFQVRDGCLEHGREIVVGPKRVDLVARAGAGEEAGRNVGGDGRTGRFREGSGARVDDADEIRARGNLCQRVGGIAVFPAELIEEQGGGRGELGSRREADDADFCGIELPLIGVCAHQADGLHGVVGGIDRGFVAIDAEAVAEDDGGHPNLVEEGDVVRPFRPDPEDLVPAAGSEDDGCAVEGWVGGEMDLDGRVVNVDHVFDRASAPS